MKKIIDEKLYRHIYDYIRKDWDEHRNVQAEDLLIALDNAPEAL